MQNLILPVVLYGFETNIEDVWERSNRLIEFPVDAVKYFKITAVNKCTQRSRAVELWTPNWTTRVFRIHSLPFDIHRYFWCSFIADIYLFAKKLQFISS